MKINLGCGYKKLKGYVNCDFFAPGADLKFDLNKCDYPFEDNTAHEIHMQAVLEHLDDVPAVLKECKRILKPGGVLHIKEFPYVSGISYYEDITHKHVRSYKAFKKLEKNNMDGGYNIGYYTEVNFRKVHVRIVFGKMLFWNYLVEPMVNTWPILYENLPLLKSLFPALYMDVRLIK